ncbi:LCP family protein [Carnobacterium maltaromaticum]|uniref:LCP family glycopolymer transferase n=1 Tax=Carnobacterium maltaromaticum TaxID=2751 RepID=UPI0039AEA91A
MRSDKHSSNKKNIAKESSSDIKSRSSRINKKKQLTKKNKTILLTILFTLLIALISYATYFALAANKAVENIQGEDLSSTSTNPRAKPVALKNKEPFSVLLLGVDERPEDSGRSDSIIVATVNPIEDSVKLVSIPRDTLLTIPGYGKDKVNAAFAYGGINLAVETVENYLNIPINFYTKINMEGMVDLVNAVGGINVDNKYAFELDGVKLGVGNFDLDGRQALQYARMRKQDPAGDFGRQERQKEVISKIVKNALSINSLTNFNKIFNAVGKNVETNFTGSELWELAKNYASTANNITNLTLEGPDGFLYYIPSYGQDVYVWQPSSESLQEVSNQLRKHLGLTAESIPTTDVSTDKKTIDSTTENNSVDTYSYTEEPYVPPVQETPRWIPEEQQPAAPPVENPPITETPTPEVPSTPEPEIPETPDPPVDENSSSGSAGTGGIQPLGSTNEGNAPSNP